MLNQLYTLPSIGFQILNINTLSAYLAMSIKHLHFQGYGDGGEGSPIN